MDQEKDLLERLASVEVQVKDIQEVKTKLDSLYNLIMDMRLDSASAKSAFATKQECATCRKDLEVRLDKMEDGRKRLFWATVTTGLAFTLWLIEQLLHVSIKIGG